MDRAVRATSSRFEVDLPNIELGPLTRLVIETLQTAGDEGAQFGYNVDVLAPPEFNEMMEVGSRRCWSATRLPSSRLPTCKPPGKRAWPRRGDAVDRNVIAGAGGSCPRPFTLAGMRSSMTGTTLNAPFVAPSISPARRSWRRYRAGILFVLPALILYLIFMVYPFFRSIYFSFTSWNGVTAVKEWVGLANYRELIGDSLFWLSLRHTVIWVIIGTIAPIVIGMLLALLLWRRPKGFTLFRTIYLHAAGALDGRHRHRLELDLQPHLRHSQ